MDIINKKGVLYFHQGWTDIINQLALVNLYSKKYKEIKLIMREDAKPMVDFYVRDKKNVSVIYSPLDIFNESILFEPNSEIIFHGLVDKYRVDNFKNAFWNNNPTMFFVKKFYITYGLDYMLRINDFDFERYHLLEEKTYQNFIKENGDKYILYHEDVERGVILNQEQKNDVKYFDLNKKSDIFFDFIKIIENAKEIHLIDSVWAALIYHMDAKYGLFKHIPIHIYCLRGYLEMFTEPIKLDNWIVK
jgi:hypothetical protein